MKSLKGINTLGFIIIAILTFFPLVTINVWGEPATTMNIIDFAFGPSDVSDWETYLSTVVKPTNLIVIAIPIIGFIFSASSDIENGFNKTMIVCIIAALVEKRFIDNIVDSIDTIPFAAAFSTTNEIWFDILNIVNEGVLIISVILLAYSAFNVFQHSLKRANTPLVKNTACKYCGAINENSAGFCIKCGKKLEPDTPINHFKTCPSCGEENKGDTAFCIKCGSKLD